MRFAVQMQFSRVRRRQKHDTTSEKDEGAEQQVEQSPWTRPVNAGALLT
jgi:hypothetical protein